MPVNINTFRKSLFHTVTAPPDQIQSDLSQLRQLDQQIERKLNRLKTLIPWVIGLGILFFFFNSVLFSFVLSNPGFLGAFPSDLVVFFLVIFALGAIVCWILPYVYSSNKLDPRYLSQLGGQFLILALVSAGLLLILQFPVLFLNPFTTAIIVFITIVTVFVIRSKTAALNLPNYRYELATRIFSMLSRDMDKTSRANLKILFKKQVDQPTRTLPFSRRPGWKIDICDNEWLKIKGSLLNGHWIQLSLTERYRKRYGKNINGKLREKYQQRGLEIKLGIRLPGQGREDLAQLQSQGTQMIRLPSGVELKQLTLSPDLLKMKVLVPQWLGGARSVSMIWPQDPPEESIRQVLQVIMMMLLSAFQILNFAHVLSRGREKS